MEKELSQMRKIVNQSDYRLYVLEWQMALWRREHIKQPFIVDLGGTTEDGSPGNFSANESLPLLSQEPDWWSFNTVYTIFLTILMLMNLLVAYRSGSSESTKPTNDSSSIRKQEKNQEKRQVTGQNQKSRRKDRRKAYAQNNMGSGQLDTSKLQPSELAFDYETLIRTPSRSPSQPK